MSRLSANARGKLLNLTAATEHKGAGEGGGQFTGPGSSGGDSGGDKAPATTAPDADWEEVDFVVYEAAAGVEQMGGKLDDVPLVMNYASVLGETPDAPVPTDTGTMDSASFSQVATNVAEATAGQLQDRAGVALQATANYSSSDMAQWLVDHPDEEGGDGPFPGLTASGKPKPVSAKLSARTAALLRS